MKKIRDKVRNYNNVVTNCAMPHSGGIVVILRNPVGTDGAKIVNVYGTLGENDRYPDDASDRRHDDGYPDPTAH